MLGRRQAHRLPGHQRFALCSSVTGRPEHLTAAPTATVTSPAPVAAATSLHRVITEAQRRGLMRAARWAPAPTARVVGAALRDSAG
jgi:hypothetical protein